MGWREGGARAKREGGGRAKTEGGLEGGREPELLNEKGRNAGLAGDRSTVSGKHTRQNGDNESLYIHALKMWFSNYYVAYAFVWCV